MPAPARRPRDAEATQTAILDAAEALFAARGLSAPLAEIAVAAGVTKSLIHHHFGSKEGLWDAVWERRFAPYAERQNAILDREPLDLAAVDESLRTLFAFLAREPSFVRLHAWSNAAGDTAVGRPSELTERGVSRLADMQTAGELRPDVAPASVLAMFFGLIEHWFQARAGLTQRFGPELPGDARYLDDVVRVLLRGLAP